jgi:NAD(P)-dependent dehydrogenase (short-subunit alcohol dehydrogenase family)
MHPVLITGISPNGLGAATAHAIAAHSPELLILASRSFSKIEEVDKTLQSSLPGLKTKLIQIDLASLQSVRRAADEINRSVERIDIIINNAGIMAVPEKQLSPDGIEMQFAANHLGHFLLTNLLVDKLKAAASLNVDKKATRVINVSSGGHGFSSIRFQDYNFEGKPVSPDEAGYPPYLARWKIDPKPVQEYNKWMAYGQSKTANILFSLALTRRLHRQGILSFAVYPGGMESCTHSLLPRFP